MEDYPKIAKFEYLSNHWTDHFKILNLGLYDQVKLFLCSKFPHEDDLKWKMIINGRLPKINKI
jgi:hypothetical protein